MSANRKKMLNTVGAQAKYFRILYLLTTVFFIAGTFIVTRIAFSADSIAVISNLSDKSAIQLVKSAATPVPKDTLSSRIPPQIEASRIKITIGETRDIPVTGAANSRDSSFAGNRRSAKQKRKRINNYRTENRRNDADNFRRRKTADVDRRSRRQTFDGGTPKIKSRRTSSQRKR